MSENDSPPPALAPGVREAMESSTADSASVSNRVETGTAQIAPVGLAIDEKNAQGRQRMEKQLKSPKVSFMLLSAPTIFQYARTLPRMLI